MKNSTKTTTGRLVWFQSNGYAIEVSRGNWGILQILKKKLIEQGYKKENLKLVYV